jgi:hypothetical protein
MSRCSSSSCSSWWILALPLLLAACGSSAVPTPDGGAAVPDPDGGGMHDAASTSDAPTSDADRLDAWVLETTDAGMPLDALRSGYCTTLGRATCTAPHDCSCPDSGPPPESIDECIEIFVDDCIRGVTEALGSMLASGRLVVDGAAMTECTARVAASFTSCSTSPEDLVAWCSIFAEPVAIGAPCILIGSRCGEGAGWCSGALVCEPRPARDAACGARTPCAEGLACRDGVCAPLGGAGEPCEQDSDCAAGSLCGAGVCAPALAPIGAPCDATDACVVGASCEGGTCVIRDAAAPCADDGQCGSHATCAPVEGSLCAPRRGPGEPCAAPTDCADGMFCDYEDGGLCAALREVGARCLPGGCVAGATCTAEGGASTCAPLGSEGDSCEAIGGGLDDGCVEGLACVAGTCARMPSVGERCGDDEECGPALVCIRDRDLDRETDHVCAHPRSEGAPCPGVYSTACDEGLFCDATLLECVRRRAAGERCDHWGPLECSVGLACLGDRGAATCEPLPGAGEACIAACEGDLACLFAGTIGGRCVPSVCSVLGAPTGPDAPPPPDVR